jgi:hypothetical protein
VVAGDAVDRCDHRLAARRGRLRGDLANQQRERDVEPVADPLRRAAHRAVDEPGQPAGPPGAGPADRRREARDRRVHRLDELGDADDRVDAQPGPAAQVGRTQRGGARGAGIGRGLSGAHRATLRAHSIPSSR